MTEMGKLESYLNEALIPFEIGTILNTPQLFYPSKKERICDVICHEFSYGYDKGLLEIMGLTDTEDGVEGCLTAEEIFNRIKKHYFNIYLK